MDKLTLYSAQVCPFAQRTRLLLAEKGLSFDLIEIDLKSPPDWFLKISPYGKVPTLEHDNRLIWESAIINEYIEEVFPEPPFMPRDPGERAWARFWIDFANTRFVPWFYKFLLEQDREKREQRRQELTDHLLFMEREALSRYEGIYWLGERLSLVDLSFYTFFERLPVLEHYRQFSLPAECQRLNDWWAEMRRLESVQRISNPPQYYIERYTHYADGSASGSTAKDMRES